MVDPNFENFSVGKHLVREVGEQFRASLALKTKQGTNDQKKQKAQLRPKGHHLVVIQRGLGYHLRLTWDEATGRPSLSIRLSPAGDDGQAVLMRKDMGARLRHLADLVEGIVRACAVTHVGHPRKVSR